MAPSPMPKTFVACRLITTASGAPSGNEADARLSKHAAASMTTGTPVLSPHLTQRSSSGSAPNGATGMADRERRVSSAGIPSGSRAQETGSISSKHGLKPAPTADSAVAGKLHDGIGTASPNPGGAVARLVAKASVPFATVAT